MGNKYWTRSWKKYDYRNIHCMDCVHSIPFACQLVCAQVHGGDEEDIAVLLLGYEKQMMDMLRNQNPGLARRFAPATAFKCESVVDCLLVLF